MGCSVSTNFPQQPGKVTKNSVEIRAERLRPAKQRKTNFQDVYRFGDVIAQSSYSEIRTCYHRNTGAKRAVKVFRKSLICTEYMRANLDRELAILKSLDHPNIIRVYDVFEDSKRVFLVMECCYGGMLRSQMGKNRRFSEPHAAHIMRQLLSSVAYLHSKQIVHRDIKPGNILLEELNDSACVKLVDFRTACSSQCTLKTAVGTAVYIAPEAISSTYTEKCDLWSCGVILHVLLTGRLPFKGRSDPEILEQVQTAWVDYDSELWSGISTEAIHLLRVLLCPEHVRLPAFKALQHPWFRKHTEPNAVDRSVAIPVMERLRQLNTGNKLRDVAERFLIWQYLTAKDIRIQQQVFQSIDKDSDGKLSREELIEELSKHSTDATEDVERIMEAADTDNSGFIDYSEFLKATVDRRQICSASNIQLVLDAFRQENSDSDLKEAIGLQAWRQLIEAVERNSELDADEFQRLIFS